MPLSVAQKRCYPCRFVVERTAEWGQNRQALIFHGMSGGAQYLFHNNNLTNGVAMVIERLLFRKKDGQFHAPTQPSDDYLAMLSRFNCKFRPYLPQLLPYKHEELIAGYKGRKAKNYSRKAKDHVFGTCRWKDGAVSGFMKQEFVASKVDLMDNKPTNIVRAIQPRSLAYRLDSLCYFKRAEKPLLYALDRFLQNDLGFPHRAIAKGMNNAQRAANIKLAWEYHDRPSGVGADISRMDQSVSVPLLKDEAETWLDIFDHCPYFTKLLAMQRSYDYFCNVPDGNIRLSGIKGRRCSGDGNTGSGNTLIVAKIMWLFAKRLLLVDISITFLIDGDDVIVFTDDQHNKYVGTYLVEFFIGFGFVMKIEGKAWELEEVEFCQSHPVNVDGEWLMVRNPKACLMKDVMTFAKFQHKKPFDTYRWNLMKCGESLAGGVPILNAFYQHVGRGAPVVRKKRQLWENRPFFKGIQYSARGMHRTFHLPSDATRESFAKAFFVSPADQIAIELYYSSFAPEWQKPIDLGLAPMNPMLATLLKHE